MPTEVIQPQQELIVMRGPQGSGKTFRAQGICQANDNFYRLNRDQLRKMITGMRYYDKGEEKMLAELESDLLYKLLDMGKSVIIDNTNLRDELVERYAGIVARYNSDEDFNPRMNIQFRIIDFRDVPLDVCIANNMKRVGTNRVPDDVIKNCFDYYSLPVEVDPRNK